MNKINPEGVFLALGIQQAAHMRHIVMWPAPLYSNFFKVSHKRHVIRKKVTEHKMCDSIFSATFV
jgi:hypothetical protein